MTYVPITDAEIDVDSPVTQVLMTKFRDNSAAQLGREQTWQDVSGSRANNTVYQNTTEKPIGVAADVSISGGTRGVFLSDDNVTFVTIYFLSSSGPLFFIVPVGHYYKIQTPGSISSWTELR
jgi:hypothetical protein